MVAESNTTSERRKELQQKHRNNLHRPFGFNFMYRIRTAQHSTAAIALFLLYFNTKLLYQQQQQQHQLLLLLSL